MAHENQTGKKSVEVNNIEMNKIFFSMNFVYFHLLAYEKVQIIQKLNLYLI